MCYKQRKINFYTATQLVVSEDIWQPTIVDLLPGWKFVRHPDRPILTIPSGIRDIPDTRWYRGYITNGVVKIPAFEKVFWHGGPNSGSWFYHYSPKRPKSTW